MALFTPAAAPVAAATGHGGQAPIQVLLAAAAAALSQAVTQGSKAVTKAATKAAPKAVSKAVGKAALRVPELVIEWTSPNGIPAVMRLRPSKGLARALMKLTPA